MSLSLSLIDPNVPPTELEFGLRGELIIRTMNFIQVKYLVSV